MKYVILLLCLFFVGRLSAQLIVVQTATRQGYASGMCCTQGVDYIVVFRVTQPHRDIAVDSVVFEGHRFDRPSANAGSLTIAKDANGSTYSIHEALRWGHPNEANSDHPRPRIGDNNQRDLPDATIYYHSNGVPHRITIPELTELMPIPYQ